MNRLRAILSTRKRKVIAVAAVLTVAGSAVALAAWLTDGTGQGAARAGTLQKIVVSQGNEGATGACFPGQSCDGYFIVVNPNPQPLTIIRADSASGGSTETASCPASNLSVNPLTGLSIALPPGTSNVVVPNVFHLDADAPTTCQGVELTHAVTLSAST